MQTPVAVIQELSFILTVWESNINVTQTEGVWIGKDSFEEISELEHIGALWF